ncbi:quinate 5-dehydrogenase [Asticcacaulis endophyticus]|uniref:Ornithine cyclodeaminase n=1 Tax=Asticcacaulis endophyticus TaxID=1395890 RepID=A0A918ULX1_9CAUL|nr:quinate 5-dehydrogenase [Asticcacaulis endophyticus]GGZ20036.1 ornithine cyclodeaminase [Asticcacaulis endophyticus]
MRIVTAEEVRQKLSYDRLVAKLPPRLRADAQVPARSQITIPRDDEDDATLLLMPAWSPSVGGLKIVHVTPGNATRHKPSVNASYLLFDGTTHEHLALIDGGELTARRTAAVAAIAAGKLAAPDATRLLLIGSGRIASELPLAYRAVRPITHVSVHSPTRANAEALVQKLRDNGFNAAVCEDLAHEAGRADIIACATLSHTPIVQGDWLTGAHHLALIGGFTPAMREADDGAIRKGYVFVDTLTALTEAGDVAMLTKNDIKGVLSDLCDPAFTPPSGLTVFKSVGEASQDLACASLL